MKRKTSRDKSVKMPVPQNSDKNLAGSVVEEYDEQNQWISPVEKELYMPMDSADQLSSSDSDSEGYTFMYKGSGTQGSQEEKELKSRKVSETEKRMSTSPVGVPTQDDVYTDCDFDSPRYVPKTREMISRSHTSSSYINDLKLRHDTDASLETSVDHFETVSEFLGKGSQDESKYLQILPEAGTTPPVVPPRTVYASKSTHRFVINYVRQYLNNVFYHKRFYCLVQNYFQELFLLFCSSSQSTKLKSIHYTRRQPIDREPQYILPPSTNNTKLT